MLIIKKLSKQCTPCPSSSIMILQKGIAISLGGQHLVLTLLVSKVIKKLFFRLVLIKLQKT